MRTWRTSVNTNKTKKTAEPISNKRATIGKIGKLPTTKQTQNEKNKPMEQVSSRRPFSKKRSIFSCSS